MDFNILLLEGRFFSNGSHILLEDETVDIGCRDLFKEIASFRDSRIHIAFHHLPISTPGGVGCCLHPSQCLHHKAHPDMLLSYKGEGVLREIGPDEWALDLFSGQRQVLPLKALAGHWGRVIAAPALTVEQMREAVAASPAVDQVEGLTAEAERLQRVLKDIAAMTRKK